MAALGTAWAAFKTFLDAVMLRRAPSEYDEDLNLLLDTITLNEPQILASGIEVLDAAAPTEPVLIHSLRDLHVGKAYVTHQGTALMRQSRKEVVLGSTSPLKEWTAWPTAKDCASNDDSEYYLSEKGGVITISVPLTSSEDGVDADGGWCTKRRMALALEKYSGKRLSDGILFCDSGLRSGVMVSDIPGSLALGVKYISSDNTMQIQRLVRDERAREDGRMAFEFCADGDTILPEEEFCAMRMPSDSLLRYAPATGRGAGDVELAPFPMPCTNPPVIDESDAMHRAIASAARRHGLREDAPMPVDSSGALFPSCNSYTSLMTSVASSMESPVRNPFSSAVRGPDTSSLVDAVAGELVEMEPLTLKRARTPQSTPSKAELRGSPPKRMKIEEDVSDAMDLEQDEAEQPHTETGDSAASGGPPPPPPPMMPPPPPMPGAKGEKSVTKSKRLMTLRWSSIPKHKLEETVWARKDSASDILKIPSASSLVSEEEVVSLFSVSPVKRKNTTTKAQGNGDALPKAQSLLSVKRSNNISIALTQFARSHSYEEIRDALLQVPGYKPLNIDQLHALSSIFPMTAKESSVIHAVPPARQASLPPAERFLWVMKGVVAPERKVKSLIFTVEFPEWIKSLDEDIDVLLSACKAVHDSECLPQILRIILAVGSVLNRDTYLSSHGFRLSSLKQLSQMRGKKNGVTLISYVAKIVAQHSVELFQVREELAVCASAAKISLQDLVGRSCRLCDGLLEMEEGNHYDVSHSSDARDAAESENSAANGVASGAKRLGTDFATSMRLFMEEAKPGVDRAQQLIEEATMKYTRALRYFGEDESGMMPAEFFTILTDFCASLNRAHEENMAREESKGAGTPQRALAVSAE